MARPLIVLATALMLAAGAAPAGAATLSLQGGTLAYAGVATAESVTVESITTGVKFFGLTSGQIAAPLPSGCSATENAAQNSQIVSCPLASITKLSFALGAGDDTLIANGLSKPTEIHGGAGRDTITGGSAADAIYGDGDVDTINSGPAVDDLFVRDGLADTVDCGGALDAIQGDTVDVFKGCESQDLSAELVADADGDGVKPPADCDDGNPARFPGASDVPGDGIDQDCDGRDAAVPAAGSGATSGAGASGAKPAGSTGASTTTTAAATTPAAAAPAIPPTTPAAAVVPAVAAALPHVTAVARVTFRLLPGGRGTRATRVVVDGIEAGSTVTIRCKGTGCPAARWRKTFKLGVRHLVLRSYLGHARLRAGTRVDVRVTRPGAVGTRARYRIAARTLPDGEVRCLAAATGLPTSC